MLDRESILPLVFGAVIAVLVNVLLLAPVAQLGGGGSGLWPDLRRDAKPMLEARNEMKFGVDNGRVSSVAWIPYEAYEELVAPKFKNLQPAVQQEVDPAPDAAVIPNPTPPLPPTPDEAPQPAPISPSEAMVEAASEASPPQAIVEAPRLPHIGDIAAALPVPEPSPTSADATPPQPQQPPPSASAGGRPTSAPKVDRDADPVMLTDRPFPVKPGRVIAAEGIEIKTVRPQFSLTTGMTAIPLNPIVSITFNADGSVHEAHIVRSSGYADVDGPVLACLYRWRAGGEALERLGQRFTAEWKILLINE